MIRLSRSQTKNIELEFNKLRQECIVKKKKKERRFCSKYYNQMSVMILERDKTASLNL